MQKEFDALTSSEVHVAISKRKRRQLIIASALSPVVLVMVFADLDGAMVTLALGALLVGVSLTFINWRCPVCERYLGASMNPQSCSMCLTPFDGSEAPRGHRPRGRRFDYEAVDAHGKKSRGSVAADDRQTACKDLERRGLHPTHISEPELGAVTCDHCARPSHSIKSLTVFRSAIFLIIYSET